MSFDALSYLTELEALQFKYCNGLSSKVLQPFLNITTPLKIKTFVIIEDQTPVVGNLNNEKSISIQSLIQKIGSYVEVLVLSIGESELRGKLFDTVIDFCKKIRYLHLNYISFTNVSQLSRMILNFQNHLKYLTVETKEDDLKVSSMILKESSKYLPLSLHYLNLNLVVDSNDLEKFFENCDQVKLKKLLIRDKSQNNIEAVLSIIKDFVKEKNLEFLTYNVGDFEEEIQYESLEMLVKEIQSFIKMKKYDDLVIRVSDIDGNLIIN
jgi:hypothetical protein